jgi:hypothetical protein
MGTGMHGESHGARWRSSNCGVDAPLCACTALPNCVPKQLGLTAFDVSIADLAHLSLAVAVGVQTAHPTTVNEGMSEEEGQTVGCDTHLRSVNQGQSCTHAIQNLGLAAEYKYNFYLDIHSPKAVL